MFLTQMHPTSDMRAERSLVSVTFKLPLFLLYNLHDCFDVVVFVVVVVLASLQMVPVSVPVDKEPEQVQGSSVVPIRAAPKSIPPKVLQGTIPSGHIPKPVILPDYIA